MLLNTPSLPYRPKKIISLVPSQTELLADLGLDNRVVGITKFCIHPAHWVSGKVKVGGTKNIQLATVRSLKPDLVIANREENTKEQVEAIAADFPVWVTDVTDLTGALQMIHDVGCLTDSRNAASALATNIQIAFADLMPYQGSLKVAYLIWRKPFMAAGGDTFIHSMLQQCGWENLFAHQKRYPVIHIDELAAQQCDGLLLSSEPYPFSDVHLAELQSALPHTRVQLVNGEAFSWYGSRLLQSPAYFQQLISDCTR